MFSAVTNIELAKANKWKTIQSAETAAVGASAGDNGYGVSFAMTDRDARYLILATNTADSATATVTVKAGNGINATAYEPSVTLAAGASAVIQVESGCFKHVKDAGAMKVESSDASIVGKVFVVSTTAAVTVQVFHTVL